MSRFTYREVVAATSPATNWSKFVVHPIVDRLLWLMANFAPVHPNVLTIAATILGLVAAGFYLRADRAGFAVGAVLFYFSFGLDAIDGALARLIDRRSALGAWLDSITDFLRSMILAPALAVGAFRMTGDIRALYLGFGVLGVALWYYYQAEVTEKVIGRRPAHLAAAAASRSTWFRKLGVVPSPFGLADYEAAYLIVGPLLGKPIEGMVVALIGGVISRLAAAGVVLLNLRRDESGKRP